MNSRGLAVARLLLSDLDRWRDSARIAEAVASASANSARRREEIMKRANVVAAALSVALIATAAHAAPSRDEVQSPRNQDEVQSPRSQDEVQSPRGQDVQAARDRQDDVQS